MVSLSYSASFQYLDPHDLPNSFDASRKQAAIEIYTNLFTFLFYKESVTRILYTFSLILLICCLVISL